jgi:hypothetical protein
MITLDNQELVQAQLTFLVERDPIGYDRAVQALEDLKLDEGDPARCFLAFYANEDTCTNPQQRINAEQVVVEACKEFIVPPINTTAVEWIIGAISGLGEPLDEEEQTFLALCKQVRAEVCSHQATGSEK